MAIIYSYPTVTPESGDLIVGTDITGKVTKNFTVGSIVTAGIPTHITGTTNTVPLFTEANTIGDSIITQNTNGDKVTIVGSFNIADSLEVGTNNVITGTNALTSGENNNVLGNSSVAFGFNNEVSGNRCGVLGANNIVTGGQVWATGDGNDVGGGNIITSGFNNTVKSGNSCVVGASNILTNTIESGGINKNFVMGSSNTLNDVNTVISLGFNNTINDNDSCVLGKSNTTSAIDTYAIGKGNTLSSEDDYAFGLNNTISGGADIAMALGHNNTLSGSQSYAFGRDLADGGEDNTVIIGRYNTVPTATGRIVFGTGFSDAGRKNAIEIQAGTGAQSGILFPAVRLSTNYNNDTQATAAGVENGELYRANNQVRINIGQGTQDARNNEGYNFLTPSNQGNFSNNSTKTYRTNYNLEVARWSGPAGNAFLNLPNPTSSGAGSGPMANRYIKIITNSTFAGSTLTLSSSAGINGSTTLVLTGAYKSASLWNDGVEWFVL